MAEGSPMRLRLNANAVVTNAQGQILFIELKKGPFKGGFCIPGGGINPGELSDQTIAREIKEETGADLMGPATPFGFCELIHKGLNSHRVVLLLAARGTGKLVETEEGIPLWVDPDDPAVRERMISFARESLRIWKEGKGHFTLVDYY